MAALVGALLLLGCGSTEPGPSPTGVVINEVLAKSPGTTKADWIELLNTGDADADIGNWALKDSRDREPFLIAAGTILKAGQYLVVEYDATGEKGFTFGLGDEDAVRLFDAQGKLVDSAEWTAGATVEGESWGRFPDGSGKFKRLATATKGQANADTCGNGTRDAVEECDGGDLGGKDCTALSFASGTLKCAACRFDTSGCVRAKTEVVVNEVVAKATSGATTLADWLELRNNGASEADLSGWTVTDAKATTVYTFADGTKLGAGAYLVVESTELGFGLGAADSVRLRDRTQVIVDETAWIDGAAPDGKSWGRSPDGTGPFKTLDAPTRGAANP